MTKEWVWVRARERGGVFIHFIIYRRLLCVVCDVWRCPTVPARSFRSANQLHSLNCDLVSWHLAYGNGHFAVPARTLTHIQFSIGLFIDLFGVDTHDEWNLLFFKCSVDTINKVNNNKHDSIAFELIAIRFNLHVDVPFNSCCASNKYDIDTAIDDANAYILDSMTMQTLKMCVLVCINSKSITFDKNEFIHFVKVFFWMCKRSSCSVLIRSFSNLAIPSRCVMFVRPCVCVEYPPGSYCDPATEERKTINWVHIFESLWAICTSNTCSTVSLDVNDVLSNRIVYRRAVTACD